jgi:hypothetical protein
MVKWPSTVRIDPVRSFMIRLIRSGDFSPFTSGGGRGLVEGPLQPNNRASDSNIRSVRKAERFKSFISFP